MEGKGGRGGKEEEKGRANGEGRGEGPLTQISGSAPELGSPRQNIAMTFGIENKKLSCRRETDRRFITLNILLRHSRLLKVIRNDSVA